MSFGDKVDTYNGNFVSLDQILPQALAFSQITPDFGEEVDITVVSDDATSHLEMDFLDMQSMDFPTIDFSSLQQLEVDNLFNECMYNFLEILLVL